MDTYTLVRPEHLNHHDYLFGGQLLKWVDEYAWLTASRDFIGQILVTRAMDNIDFKTRILNGSILRFNTLPKKQGKTSITYCVKVYANEPGQHEEKLVFSTLITFVSVDKRGFKKQLPQMDKYKSKIRDRNQFP